MAVVDVHDEASLMRVCDLLHDARCDVDAAVYDDSGVWRSSWTVRHRADVYRLQLELSNVISLRVDDRSGIGTFMFNECRRRDDGYWLEFIEELDIYLAFDGPPQGCLRLPDDLVSNLDL